MVIVMKMKIFTYYTAFCFIDAATIASGLAYDGKDKTTGKEMFDRIDNVIIKQCEGNYRIQTILNGWNRSTHYWLKYYIFLRLVKKGERNRLTPIFCTFVVSAIWHGFYPGYFVNQLLNDNV